MNTDSWQWWLVAALWFFGGWGWGQWWAERNARHERQALEAGRIAVSMPADPQDAALTLQLLSALVRKAEAERGKPLPKAE